MTEEKYAIFISLFHDCQFQLIDKWQYYLIDKHGMQHSEWVCGSQRVAKDQTFLREGMQIVKNIICSF